MARKRSDDLESVTHNARLRFVKHELLHGLALARTALAEKANPSLYEDCKAKAFKTHDDFANYLTGISATLTAGEEEELEADLRALKQALDALE